MSNGVRYIDTDGEVIAISLIPKVIKNGLQIGRHENHKERRYSTSTFASRVVIGETDGIMAVVVREESKNYYKLHLVFLPDGSSFVFDAKKESTSERAVAQNVGLSPADTAFSTSIISKNSDLSTVSTKKFPKREILSMMSKILESTSKMEWIKTETPLTS